MDATNQTEQPLRSVKRGRPARVAEVAAPVVSGAAQSYAERVWSGQSVDVPTNERLERVRAALIGQNLDCAGVVLEGYSL